MLVGYSGETARASTLGDARFARLLKGASSFPAPEMSIEDVESAVEVLAGLALLIQTSLVDPTLVEVAGPLVQRTDKAIEALGDSLRPDHIDHLHTALTRLGLSSLAPAVCASYSKLQLPFVLIPGILNSHVSLDDILSSVPFEQSTFVTVDKKTVKERRKTCWMVDTDGPPIGGLSYSGKVQKPVPFVHCIKTVRDVLFEHTNILYDCCLINLYDDGECACAWHVDPDLGSVFSRDTHIVSVGESRRFALRQIVNAGSESMQNHHVHHVHNGDAFGMHRDCQERFQHSILTAEGPQNSGPRVSIVFKKTIPGPGGKRGHGIPKEKTQRKAK